MLVELVVENYAVVERIRVRFHRGLNLLTGETGSGKSIVVDALELLFGGRASSEVVRTGAGRARVSGIFEAPSTPAFRRLLEENGIELEEGELLIEREVQASGKSRAFLGSRPVSVTLLREIAPHLGDLHGQHDQQLLFQSANQLEMLDAFGGNRALSAAAGTAFRVWHSVRREIDEMDRGEQEKLRLADLWSFQKREIEELSLKRGEDGQLEADRRVLLSTSRLQENAEAAYGALYDSPGAALGQVRQARRRLEELAKIDPATVETLESLRPAEIAIEEVAHSLRGYMGSLEADPERLDQVESRLAAIEKLKRKYGGTIEEILRFLDDVGAKLSAIENAAERKARLAKDLESASAAYEKASAELTAARQTAAKSLEKAVQAELAEVAMGGTVFRIELKKSDWSPLGSDQVRFVLSANAGEEPKPLDKIASGGELSRLALSLETCISAKETSGGSSQRTLVFDEIDTGIGGAAAEAVGRRLKKLARGNQLLCVTHLAQVAGFADHHYRVEKHESAGRTSASVEELSPGERTREIARMLSGQKLTEEAVKHAERLIRMATA
jgi:DNA repair protein RecN (Recombination protein N)